MALRRPRELWQGSPAIRAGVWVAALIVVAEGAVLLLSPAEQGIPPVEVTADDYFPAAQVERAEEYRNGQRLLLIGGLAAQAIAVGVLASGRPRRAREALERLANRRVLGAALAGALVVAVAEAAALPASLWAHERAVDAGISVQSGGSWLFDWARSLGIEVVIAAGAAVALTALIRRFPRRWWIPGSVAVVGYGAFMSLVAPVVIAPVFNEFEELPRGSTERRSVVELAERGGVDVGEVLRIDASRRSTALNAYVAGLGPTKRVVLYDTLIEDAAQPELESVVAHELAHAAHSDIVRGIAFAALITPLGLLAVREMVRVAARGDASAPGTPASVPALFLAIGIVAFVASIPANQLSRKVEASADAYALRITADPDALISLQERLALRNLSDPDSPGWAQVLFGTHPTTLERIGSALAWREARQPDG